MILTPVIQAALVTRISLADGKTGADVPDTVLAKLISDNAMADILALKTKLGVDSDHTFRVYKGQDGNLRALGPAIRANDSGEVVLVWGTSEVPLDKGQMTIEEEDGKVWAEVEDTLFPLLLADSNVTKADLRKALKAGTLGDHLSRKVAYAVPLIELADVGPSGEVRTFDVTHTECKTNQWGRMEAFLTIGGQVYRAKGRLAETINYAVGSAHATYQVVLEPVTREHKGYPVLDARMVRPSTELFTL
jgi:hypothetical protein